MDTSSQFVQSLSSSFISYIQTLLLNDLTKHANIASDHACSHSVSTFWSTCRFVCRPVKISVSNLLLPCRSMEKPQSINMSWTILWALFALRFMLWPCLTTVYCLTSGLFSKPVERVGRYIVTLGVSWHYLSSFIVNNWVDLHDASSLFSFFALSTLIIPL